MDSSSSQPENKTGKTNMSWTQDIDNLLIDTLAEQVNLGNKVDKNFKSPTYTAAARAISTKFSIECTQGYIRNRLKTIKQNFVILKNLLNQSGFAWNDSTKTIDATPDVWATYIEAHPEAKQFR
ncbi:PREDICTED: L10-interacting MYB domain-containing protein-like [Nelumbo nucifera]|uniref:L10-interacting MYB domain-containing protein-like n=1 Tax=Nelumbo nucifera TaxID=4432 RepID=A0A1U8Q696_NELNU|nr:PREDICTED: L10-interacting MYB domain-containing protein-like [Nelumbo nucifera]